ncbi:hypothetical protein BT96DRAFT_979321 [Gymnopus androsaceus JB14]|uniref:Uncharacterized protein n=1 Tax=Gymnopus androsaceus JB14 TaxID=1447944 RepID=A0A6A4H4C8_9AGAR|nr:hypothetical protein BT96DRAFT_979321 [Gymnopus androsaceus JB14]
MAFRASSGKRWEVLTEKLLSKVHGGIERVETMVETWYSDHCSSLQTLGMLRSDHRTFGTMLFGPLEMSGTMLVRLPETSAIGTVRPLKTTEWCCSERRDVGSESLLKPRVQPLKTTGMVLFRPPETLGARVYSNHRVQPLKTTGMVLFRPPETWEREFTQTTAFRALRQVQRRTETSLRAMVHRYIIIDKNAGKARAGQMTFDLETLGYNFSYKTMFRVRRNFNEGAHSMLSIYFGQRDLGGRVTDASTKIYEKGKQWAQTAMKIYE